MSEFCDISFKQKFVAKRFRDKMSWQETTKIAVLRLWPLFFDRPPPSFPELSVSDVMWQNRFEIANFYRSITHFDSLANLRFVFKKLSIFFFFF